MTLDFSGEAGKLLDECVEEYNGVVENIDATAKSQDKRPYSGVVMAAKGTMTETIAQKLLQAAWAGMGNNPEELQFKKTKYDIPIRRKYVNKIADKNLREEILADIGAYKIRHSADIHAHIGGKFVLSVECKTYTENAMLKRVLFDAYLLQQKFPKLHFALVQLENQLGGDYGNPGAARTHGSRQSHTLMSYMDTIDLHIVTLLEGDRKVKEPIHKPEFYKPLKRKNLEKAAATLAKLLIPPKK